MLIAKYYILCLPRRLLHFISLFVICISPASFAVDTLTFASGAPLNNYQAKIIVPILTEAFAQHDIQFKAVYLPSLRALRLSNSGALDGELHRVSNFHQITNSHYKNLIRIDCKLLSVNLTLFAKEPFVINNWQDLQHYNIVYHRGRKNVDKYLNAPKDNKRIFKANTDIQAFHMLAKNRVDIVISEGRLGVDIIQSHAKFNNVKKIKHLSKTDIYAYIHKKHRALLPAINKTLMRMKTQGRFKAIIDATAVQQR